MRKLDKELENRVINYDILEQYGFILDNNIYTYEKNILDNKFKVIVQIFNSEMQAKIIEIAINDEYIMADIENATGYFVGKIKEAYNGIINDIIEKCTSKNIFKSNQAKKIIKYVKNKYNDDLEYLWTKFPNNAIWRNKKNNKWYGALLTVEERKLGIDSNKIVEIIDLKYPKTKIKDIIDNKKIYEGYHMNKDNWITIRLDESIELAEIYKLIDNSYELSLEK